MGDKSAYFLVNHPGNFFGNPLGNPMVIPVVACLVIGAALRGYRFWRGMD
jgi:hypothetical protein